MQMREIILQIERRRLVATNEPQVAEHDNGGNQNLIQTVAFEFELGPSTGIVCVQETPGAFIWASRPTRRGSSMLELRAEKHDPEGDSFGRACKFQSKLKGGGTFHVAFPDLPGLAHLEEAWKEAWRRGWLMQTRTQARNKHPAPDFPMASKL